MHCQFGSHYFGNKIKRITSQEEVCSVEKSGPSVPLQPHNPKKKKERISLQGTRKIGCTAGIHIREYILYPEYKVVNVGFQSNWQLRKAKESILNDLKEDLLHGKSVKRVAKYFVSLPTEEAHHKTHMTGGMHALAQRIHPKVISKIRELVEAGIYEVPAVKRALKLYVTSLPKPPNTDDRAYYPLNSDLSNHIYKAKLLFQLSKLDQESLALKVDEWKASNKHINILFRPYKRRHIEKQCCQEEKCVCDNDCNSTLDYEQTLLWIHQEPWQQELMINYGNLITLIDATYKTTRYELPLFFLSAKTNVGYSPIAQFVIHHERMEDIAKALQIIKDWNPAWSPKFFMSDYSEVEMMAAERVFPNTKLYLCDFHREQSWERWIKNHQNEVKREDQDSLLELLRSCAWAPPSDPTLGLPIDANYQRAVKDLQDSHMWKENKQLKFWLNTFWLSIPEVLL